MDNNLNGSSGCPAESEELYGEHEWAFGYSAAMGSLDVPPNTKMSYPPPMNVQRSQGLSIDNNHCNQDSASLKSKAPAKKKNVARRGASFSKEEDLVVCSAFLNISKDPITGVNQTSGGYYKRMHDYFNEHKPEGSDRSQIAVQRRWALIQKAMNKFCAHKVSVDRMNESGKNEQDRIDDAVKMYEETEPFTIMHCWKVLRNEAKWNEKFLELNNSISPNGMPYPPTQGQTSGHEESGNAESRPEGRDGAKRRKSKNCTEASSSSAAVEVLHRLQEKAEQTEEKQDKQMAEILSRKDEKN
ncbi:unnamed protein product [Urochloa humidicola]